MVTKKFLKSPHIQIALATGFSIVLLAYFSKRVLAEPIGSLLLAIPPFIATIFELLMGKHKKSNFLTPWYWVAAVLISTAIIILLNL